MESMKSLTLSEPLFVFHLMINIRILFMRFVFKLLILDIDALVYFSDRLMFFDDTVNGIKHDTRHR